MLPVKAYIKNPRLLLSAIIKQFSFFIPNDKIYLEWRFYLLMGTKLDFNAPKTFCEKIQWLKLYNRKPEYTCMVDKFEVKKHVANIIGEKYIIPTLGVWNNIDDIDFDSLPRKFVIKTTHDGGAFGVIICRDKTRLDVQRTKIKLDKSLKRNHYLMSREWAYKNVVPQIIAETLLEDINKGDLIDYKFYCFNGRVEYCQVIRDRRSKETIDFYDRNWIHQDFVGLNPMAKQSLQPIEKPKKYQEMIEIAEKLSSDIPFVRIDLYNIEGMIYFGEITLYPSGGFGVFKPFEWNEKLGSMIKLPIR